MSSDFKRFLPVGILVLLVAAGLFAASAMMGPGSLGAPENSLLVISPYRYNGTWVFDDDRVGLVREPFVAGVPEMIDVLVADIPDAGEGFRLTFSGKPFPDYQKKLTWLRGDREGNWYSLEDPPMEGWICPAMFRYFKDAPKELYVRADAVRE